MAIVYKLQGGTVATATSLADLGLSSPKLTRRSLATDELSFMAAGAAIDSAALFAYGDAVTLTAEDGGSTVLFRGVCTQTPRSAIGRREDLRYIIAGTWWYLEQLVFQQNWPTTVSSSSRRAFIVAGFNPPAGTRQNTKAFVQDVLDWVTGSGSGAVLQYSAGALPTGFEVPFTRLESPTCAEALTHICRWMPDAASSIDYSTTPPTFRLKRRTAATTAELDLADGIVTAVDLAPRYDLQLDRMVIQYVTAGSGGAVTLAQEVDPVGTTGREFGTAVFVVDNSILPIASGLAAAYRAGLSALQYAGQIVIEERECTQEISPGMLINVVGGAEEWETMNAQVQEVIEELDTGRTTLRLGPPNHIRLDDFIEILKIARGQTDQNGGGEVLRAGKYTERQQLTYEISDLPSGPHPTGPMPSAVEISDAIAAAYASRPAPAPSDSIDLTVDDDVRYTCSVLLTEAAATATGYIVGFQVSGVQYYARATRVAARRKFRQALTVAGAAPLASEISDACTAAFAGADRPQDGDIVLLTHSGRVRKTVTVDSRLVSGDLSGLEVIGFTLPSGVTYYASVQSTAIWA